jgi:hypothetical protein
LKLLRKDKTRRSRRHSLTSVELSVAVNLNPITRLVPVNWGCTGCAGFIAAMEIET